MLRGFQTLTLLLILSYSFSLFANLAWFFDFFSHFLLQYAIGGLVLGAILAALKQWPWFIAALVVCVLSMAEIYNSYQISVPSRIAPDFRIVQYNRNHGLSDHTDTRQWLIDNSDSFDIIVLQEAGADIAALAEELKAFYPHQIIEDRPHAFGMVILSRHEFTSEKMKMSEGPYANFILHFTLQPKGFSSPVSIYALHALTPIGTKTFEQRNRELDYLSHLIQKDRSDHIIALGDFNITPYAPAFQKLSVGAKLKNEVTSPWTLFTWPNQFQWPIFQIPIDHILHRGDLRLLQKNRGPAFGSDHYSVIASFAISAQN